MSRLYTGIAALLIALPAQAVVIKLQATLERSQEPPPTSTTTPITNPGGLPRPESFGVGEFWLDITPGSENMLMVVTVRNIDVGGPGINGGAQLPGNGTQTPNDSNDDLVAAHIHVGTGVPGVSTSPVRWGFWGNPFNNNSLPLDGSMEVFTNAVGGIFRGEWDGPEGNSTTLVAQLADILAGRAYINYHTGQFGGGEIRGQLLVVGEVPEPGTLALFGLGTLGLGLVPALRRRRR
jgi:hypothetical protein